METLILFNNAAGCGNKIDKTRLAEKFGGDFVEFDGTAPIIPDKSYDVVIGCGGDGTLNHLLNDFSGVKIYYIPCGTFNEASKCLKKCGETTLDYAGEVNEKLFSYVLATGAFTPLGYAVGVNQKKKIKVLAYLMHVIGEYKVVRIPAEITACGVTEKGEYSLIMLSRSSRCFGFNFNRAHNPVSEKFQLLTIRAPKHDKILGMIEMFFPFFRAFFIGFGREHRGKTVNFLSLENAQINIISGADFCADGDKWQLEGKLTATIKKLQPPVTVVNPKNL